MVAVVVPHHHHQAYIVEVVDSVEPLMLVYHLDHRHHPYDNDRTCQVHLGHDTVDIVVDGACAVDQAVAHYDTCFVHLYGHRVEWVDDVDRLAQTYHHMDQLDSHY